jgi:hypothetical protein
VEVEVQVEESDEGVCKATVVRGERSEVYKYEV